MRVTQGLRNKQANILISYYDWQLFQILVITQPSLISINQMGIPTKSSKRFWDLPRRWFSEVHACGLQYIIWTSRHFEPWNWWWLSICWHEFIREANVHWLRCILVFQCEGKCHILGWLILQVGTTIYMQVFCKVECSFLTRATIWDRTFHARIIWISKMKIFPSWES